MGTPCDASGRAADLLNELGLWDTVLERLRSEGFSQTESIKATVERLGLRLPEAKRIVHLSSAWSDVRSGNESFHLALGRAAGPNP